MDHARHDQAGLRRRHGDGAELAIIIAGQGVTGTLDGVAYWPEGVEPGYFATMGTTLEAEIARYDGVIFLQTAAAGGHSIEGGNPARIETNAQATALDEALQQVWRAHPRFVFIPNHRSFMKKLTDGIGALTTMARDLGFPLGD